MSEYLLNTISQQPTDPVAQKLDEIAQKINTLSLAAKSQKSAHEADKKCSNKKV